MNNVHPLRSDRSGLTYPAESQIDTEEAVILLTYGFIAGIVAAAVWHTLTQRTTP